MLSDDLKVLLASCYGFAIKAQNFHWNVTGPNFGSLHSLFETQYNDLAQASDDIAERMRAINSKVEIRPIMYLALSYDHRIIDGKESVGFLVKVKEILEKPEIMMVEGIDSFEKLFDL